MKDNATRMRFIELRGAGLSFARIAAEIGVSKPTLVEWNRRYSAEITTLQSAEMDALLERLAVTRQARIEAYAEILQAARDDIRRRLEKSGGVFSMTDEKLADLLLKLGARIEGEERAAATPTATVTEEERLSHAIPSDVIMGLNTTPRTGRLAGAWPNPSEGEV